MNNKIVQTLKQKYEAQIAEYVLNIDIMLANPMSIPEHSDFVSEIDKQLTLLAEAKDKLEALTEHF